MAERAVEAADDPRFASDEDRTAHEPALRAMIEQLHANYVRTARAFGIPEWRVYGRYALRNAFLPTLTILGIQAGAGSHQTPGDEVLQSVRDGSQPHPGRRAGVDEEPGDHRHTSAL